MAEAAGTASEELRETGRNASGTRRRFRPPGGVYRPGAVLVGAVLTAVAVAWLGGRSAPLPTAAGDGSAGSPGWRVFAMFAGVLPLLALRSPMAELEALGSSRFHRSRGLRLAGLWGASVLLFLGIAAVAVEGRVLGAMAVALPGWAGLGLLGGRALGWRQAWVLPGIVLCAVTYWGFDDAGGTYPWWDMTRAPVTENPLGALVSAVLLLTGLLAFSLTPWRLRRLARPLRRLGRKP